MSRGGESRQGKAFYQTAKKGITMKMKKHELGIGAVPIVIGIVVVVVIVGIAAFILQQPAPAPSPSPGPGGQENVFVVYRDAGIPSDADIYTWDSYRGWNVGEGEATFDGNCTDVAGIPEGSKCFLTISNNGNNYAGWGVFFVKPSAHTNDLSGYSTLKFWVKTGTNLKVEIQPTNASGTKKAVYINRYGWDGTDTWQEISIPKSAFSGVDFTDIYCPFMITVEAAGKTFYVDDVVWV
jgi:hypothetical protein